MTDHEDREPRRLRDVDSAAGAFRIHAFAWSIIAAVPFLLIGAYVGSGTDSPILITALFALGGFTLAYFGSLAIGGSFGRVASSLYFPGGRSTRGRREYSFADSLMARARFDDAIRELEQAAARYPDDPEPPLRLARVLRDHCARPEDAVRWFRTAVERGGADAGVEIGALREIIEVYTHVLRRPGRALPYLARLASRHADAPAGQWARREMMEIRQSMREEEGA